MMEYTGQGKPKEVVFYGEYDENSNTKNRKNIIREEISNLKDNDFKKKASNLIANFAIGEGKKVTTLFADPSLLELSDGGVVVLMRYVSGNVYVIVHVCYCNAGKLAQNDVKLASDRSKVVATRMSDIEGYARNLRSEYDEQDVIEGGYKR